MDALIIRPAEVDPNTVRPGWVALLIVAGLAIATFLLWRNMRKQMDKIDFDERHPRSADRTPPDRDATPDGTQRPDGGSSAPD